MQEGEQEEDAAERGGGSSEPLRGTAHAPSQTTQDNSTCAIPKMCERGSTTPHAGPGGPRLWNSCTKGRPGDWGHCRRQRGKLIQRGVSWLSQSRSEPLAQGEALEGQAKQRLAAMIRALLSFLDLRGYF
ncbi:unnamed protein product [Prorocentrum cordatum]|uniref:Uncharacterized protein n=1 Tax=Prorocentrum cordatum TaxID=2364126 RepID=A0ABN9PC98_9DINO|nr:unnamed protein product [Polarella glacialis]